MLGFIKFYTLINEREEVLSLIENITQFGCSRWLKCIINKKQKHMTTQTQNKLVTISMTTVLFMKYLVSHVTFQIHGFDFSITTSFMTIVKKKKKKEAENIFLHF